MQWNDADAKVYEARVNRQWDKVSASLPAATFDGWKSSPTNLDEWTTNMKDGAKSNWDNTEWTAAANEMVPSITCDDASNACDMKFSSVLLGDDAAEDAQGMKVGDKAKCQGAMTGMFRTSSAKNAVTIWDAVQKGSEISVEILKGASSLVAGAVAIAAATLF